MYTLKSPHLKPIGTHATNSSLASNAVIESWSVQRPCKILELQCAIETTLSSSGDTVVTFKKYPVHGSSSNAVTLGTLNIPTTTAAGKCVYKRITPVFVMPGEQIVAEVTTAATSAGKGSCGVIAADDPDTEANLANMVVST